MRVLTCIALAACLLGAPPLSPAAAQVAVDGTSFVAGFEDLPLMPGLVQEPNGVTVFESPYGRFAESWASADRGRVDRAAVLSFYGATLPQLGWARADETTFTREGEALTLDVRESGAVVVVRFHVSPGT